MSVCARVNVSVCVCSFYVLYYSPTEGVGRKTDQVDFTDWMSFLPFNLMEKIIAHTGTVAKISENT